MKRSLSLRRESLSELTNDELYGVAGGIAEATGRGATCPLVQCVTGPLTYDCPTYTCCTGSASC